MYELVQRAGGGGGRRVWKEWAGWLEGVQQ